MTHRVSSSVLDEAIKEVMAAWGETRDAWRDTKAVEFEKAYLERLPLLASQARTVIEEMDAAMRKIHHDCDP
jgi:hypothetical protein